MVEHEVSVETTQVETDTVRFCDFCGSPEDAVESIERLFTADHGPTIYEYDPRMEHETVEWSVGMAHDRFGHSARENQFRVDYDREGIAEACEACIERLGEGEIPNPGVVHLDRSDGHTAAGDEAQRFGTGPLGALATWRAFTLDAWDWTTRNWAWVLLFTSTVAVPVTMTTPWFPLGLSTLVLGALGVIHDVLTEAYE